MSEQDDIARIIEQENALQFERFDEETALRLGLAIKARAEAAGQAVTIDIRTWDRPLFAFSMPGTNPDNHEWMRRKINAVRRYQRASYRLMLERGENTPFKPSWGLDHGDFVFAGGCFPIRVRSAGCIGTVTVSGLPGRIDHGLVVASLCAELGADYEALALAEA